LDVKNIIISRETVSENDIPVNGKKLPYKINLITLPTMNFKKIYSKDVKVAL
jgi:hypothetical protein